MYFTDTKTPTKNGDGVKTQQCGIEFGRTGGLTNRRTEAGAGWKGAYLTF